ncbi:amidohydrolase [Metaplanococcus flavidus]|uniref:Amidohydrolase n=1 Tax=Metaplanococcus flavidus TaxID=569883 RepID=A0ABW3L976_9BACL
MESKNFELAKRLRHELHQHPELSNEEVWTKKHLIDFLKSNTELEIVDKGNWFYAAYRAKEGERNVAFRADYDALPMDEVIDLPYGSKFPRKAHKCGHDGHAATLAAFALEIDQKGADRNIFFLFQPAEETADGAIQCADLIKEENIDEIFGYHNMSGQPFQSVAVIDGTAQFASKGMTISMKGTPAHASSPEDGVNPSFAIANIINELPEFTGAMKGQGRVFCTVICVSIGSKAFGISPGEGELLLTLRALHEENLHELQKNLENLVEVQAKRYGLSLNFSYTDEFPETFNHKESSDKVRQIATATGMQLIEMKEALRISEDYGHYTKLTKGAYFYLGNGEDYPHIHTSGFDFRDELIETGVELFKGLAEL